MFVNHESITSRLVGVQEEIQILQVHRRLHHAPNVSQRVLDKELCISLGGINYCFQVLMEEG